jgi:hypothetical protein
MASSKIRLADKGPAWAPSVCAAGAAEEKDKDMIRRSRSIGIDGRHLAHSPDECVVGQDAQL